ncbi:MAG: ABC-type branched-chain amino acid transport system periplasmic component-like protein [Frankiales bacterium]|nr:ABC-type branched-chain amino acid transport system periplasmic component-like protein [Frankiales bacterium]
MRSRPSPRPAVRLVAVLAVGALATTACGARLSTAQRTTALSQYSGTGGAGPAGGTDGGATSGTGATGATGTTGTGTALGTTGTGPAAGTSGTGTTGSTSTSGTTGAASGDFRAAPASGNGGATDVGITKDSITIYNISDISGAVPGLFEDARFANQAYIKYFTAQYGTLYGRKIILKTLDSQLDAGPNRSAALELCQNGFAGVGSLSAFDQGAADPERQCGVPDVRAIATTDQIKAVPNVYPVNAAGTGHFRGLAQFAWAASSSDPKIRASIKKAGYVYSDGDVTRQQSSQDKLATAKAYGFNWVADEPFPTSSTDYTAVVADLKKHGAEFVTFSGAYQQAAGIVKTMQDQDYHPVVWEPTVTAYTPDYLQQAGSAAEGTYVGIQPTLLSEASFSPELQTYAQWLTQVRPDAVPTDLGQFAWGAAALFIDKMIKLGPKPTRKGLLALLAQEHNYTDKGLFPGQDVGGRKLSDCIQIVQVRNGRFVRALPTAAHTWRCADGYWDFGSNRKLPGYPR